MNNKNAIAIIMLGVLAWGLFHAVGAYWNFSTNSNPWRFVVVLGFVLAFLLFWLTMLAARNRRLARRDAQRMDRNDAA